MEDPTVVVGRNQNAVDIVKEVIHRVLVGKVDHLQFKEHWVDPIWNTLIDPFATAYSFNGLTISIYGMYASSFINAGTHFTTLSECLR